MKLTDLETKILFDALTDYKAKHSHEIRYEKNGRELGDAVSSLRSKLKKALHESTTTSKK